MKTRFEEIQAACSDLIVEVQRLLATVAAQEELVEAAEYFIMTNRSSEGAARLKDAVIAYQKRRFT